MTATNTVKIGTRKSPLALWQAEYVKARIEEHTPGISVELVPIVTKGDKILDVALSKVGGKGLFVKELEVALLNGDVDLCVHSTKDMPAELPGGLGLICFPPRADPTDALVEGGQGGVMSLPHGARVGTSSLRRQAQLLAKRPDLEIVPVRGNIQTRMKKVQTENLACVVLASAGIDRMEEGERIGHRFTVDEMLPAAAQGILSIEARVGDARIAEIVAPLNDDDAFCAAQCERAFLATLGGGCQVPIAAHATFAGDKITLRGMVARPDGTALIHGALLGDRHAPAALGRALGEKILGTGGRRVLIDLGLYAGAQSTEGEGLAGRSVIVTREDAPDDTLSLALAAHGANVLPLKLMKLSAPENKAPLAQAARGLADYDVLAFTSRHGVAALFSAMDAAGTDLRGFRHDGLIGAVGAATAAELKTHGAVADVIGDGGGEKLAEALIAARAMKGVRVLFVRAERGRDELNDALVAAGAQVDVVDGYRHDIDDAIDKRTEMTLQSATLQGGDLKPALVITSPRRAELVLTARLKSHWDPVEVVAIGETTAERCRSLGATGVRVATKPTPSAVLDVLYAKP